MDFDERTQEDVWLDDAEELGMVDAQTAFRGTLPGGADYVCHNVLHKSVDKVATDFLNELVSRYEHGWWLQHTPTH